MSLLQLHNGQKDFGVSETGLTCVVWGDHALLCLFDAFYVQCTTFLKRVEQAKVILQTDTDKTSDVCGFLATQSFCGC